MGMVQTTEEEEDSGAFLFLQWLFLWLLNINEKDGVFLVHTTMRRGCCYFFFYNNCSHFNGENAIFHTQELRMAFEMSL